MLSFAKLVSTHLLRTIFLFLLILDLILGGVAAFFYYPALSSLIYPNQQTSPIVTQILQSANKSWNKNEYKAYQDKVSQIAVGDTTIEIDNCVLSPRIIRVEKTATITFKNNGKTTTYITLARQEPLRIEAQASITTDLSFIEGTPSIIGIGCSGKKEASGILYVPK